MVWPIYQINEMVKWNTDVFIALHNLNEAYNTVTLNLLHAEVSYIIDTSCHWTFFPILPVLATFWNAKIPDFFHFPTPNFLFLALSNLCSPMSGLDKSAKTRYQPIFRHCLGLFYNI